uniref:F-box domain-containing protein n=1 Tax=Mycena chlorophos TaxID=658473 RepID=A0ABQ0KUM2_MYCCL|nr:predicted protein [Mycena chlorophos]
MHRCLQIPEIILNIVDEVSPRQLKTFLSFGLACRAFQNAALDKIWEGPADHGILFRNLLYCFPQDLLETVVDTSGQVKLRLCRPLKRGDWERPALYCARVRHVSLSYAAASRYAPILSFIAVTFTGEFLFPRIRSLYWDMSNPAVKHRDTDLVAFIRLLVPHTLQEMRLEKPHGGFDLMLSVLPAISTRVRALTELDLGSGPMTGCSVDECGAISDLVLCLDRVQCLSVPAIDGRAWLHLAQLPDLDSLTLETSLDVLDVFPRDTTVERPFPKLARLSMGYVTVPVAIRILSLVARAPLDSLFFTPAFSTHPGDLAAFYAALAETTHLTETLQSVNQSRSHRPRNAADAPQSGVPRAALVSLGSFSQLIHIFLQSFGPFDMDEPTLLGLARSCPQLQTLRLTQNGPGSILPLNALVGLASFCPHLEEINITFDTTTIPSLRATGTNGERRAKLELLTELGVGQSAINEEQVFDMARFVSGLCPALSYIFCDLTPQTGADALWARVRLLTLSLHQVRKEEREWVIAGGATDDEIGDDEMEDAVDK